MDLKEANHKIYLLERKKGLRERGDSKRLTNFWFGGQHH